MHRWSSLMVNGALQDVCTCMYVCMLSRVIQGDILAIAEADFYILIVLYQSPNEQRQSNDRKYWIIHAQCVQQEAQLLLR